ncbi:MAG: DUF5522 domain-containing protein [Imperialibacter sp.]|uniref:DUF5522 domain-containing protein n=1 Tax=Imperialibacter sp. TaxID=2038411 RepID=UPI0032EEA754
MEKESAKKVEYGLKTEDYYHTKEGFLVFTKEYHLKRGYCCKSGCRHCPYDYKRKDA